VYLDDVIVIGHMFQKHLLHLQDVFKCFRETRLEQNLESANTFRKKLQYFGRTVAPHGVTTGCEN
jgi:hypothetical protein